MIQLPQYQCHKKVTAAKITDMKGNGDGTHTIRVEFPGGLIGGNVEVPAAFMVKHAPEVGGYFVVYEDGYQSYSPAKVFDDGYTLIPQDTGAKDGSTPV